MDYYINLDYIEKDFKRDGYYDVRGLNLPISESEIIHFFDTHPLINRTDEADFVQSIRFMQKRFIDFANVNFNACVSIILTDFLRHKLIDAGRSFTFATVISSADMVETLKKAHEVSFRNYLYYVAAEDLLINSSRIQN